jgi:WD40 repeat protein
MDHGNWSSIQQSGTSIGSNVAQRLRDVHSIILSHKDTIKVAAAHVYILIQFLLTTSTFPHEHRVPLVLQYSPLMLTSASICLQEHKSAVLDLAISPDGKSFASASKDHHICTWDAPSGQVQKLFEGHMSYVYLVAYLPDGLNLVAGSWDGWIIIWSLGSPGENKILTSHTDQVLAVAFSPDGMLIVSGSWDKNVRMWEAATGRSLWIGATHGSPVVVTAFLPDGGSVASASTDHTIWIWDTKTEKPVQQQVFRHDDHVYGVVWSPDGLRLASCSKDRTIAIWSRHHKRPPLVVIRHDNTITSVIWVPHSDDILLASALDKDWTVCQWSSVTGHLLAIYAGHITPIHSIAALLNGQTFVSGCKDGTICKWDARSCTVLPWDIDEPQVKHISFVRKSPNSAIFAACSISRDIKVVETASGRHLGVFQASASPEALSFSEDGTILVTSHPDGSHDDWLAGRDFEVPSSPVTTLRADITFSADTQGWIFASCDGQTTSRRAFLAPKDLRWSDWSLQAASVGAVLAFGSDSGVLTVMDFTSVLTKAT